MCIQARSHFNVTEYLLSTSLPAPDALLRLQTPQFNTRPSSSLSTFIQDVENNTILILLAELRPGSTNPYYSTSGHPDLLGAALRMAQLYYNRYPFILEWSNTQGKSALHVAALKGNEELVRVRYEVGSRPTLM